MTTGPRRGPARAAHDRSGAGWSEVGTAAAASVADDDLTVDGDHRYLDVELAGVGGMGMVMMAHDRRLGRDIAIKRVAVDGDDPAAERRLAREARITARLEHPGIVPVYDAGVGPDGRSYYAMRLIRGRSLAEVLVGAPALDQRLPLVRQFLVVCQSVAYAHRHGVLHLDLKPTNVMLGELGETLVVDWGLARELGEAAEPGDDVPRAARPAADGAEPAARLAYALTDPGGAAGDDALATTHRALPAPAAPAGTPAYLSPERARGEPGDATADVWALGAILVELLTGARLLPGSTIEILHALTGPPPPPRAWPERCPPELCAIADKALAWRPGDRYADAEALSRDVAAYLDGRRVTAHDYSTVELARRLIHAWRWQLAAVAAALIAAIGVLALSRSRIEGQRQRAVAAEHRARDGLIETRAALTRALEQSGVAALVAGDNAAAETYAAAALDHGESVDARGVLAATRAGARPGAGTRLDLGGCADVVPDDDRHALCRDRDELALWDLPAAQPRWRRPLRVGRVASLRGRWVVALDTEVSAVVLDGATGDVRLRIPVASTVSALVRDRDGARVVLHDRHHLFVVAPDQPDAAAIRELAAPCPPTVTVDAVAVGAATTFAICGDGAVVALDDGGGAATVARIPAMTADRQASAAALDAAGATLAIGTLAGELLLIDLPTGAVGAPVRVLDERVARIQLVAGMIALVGERGGARVWNHTLDAEVLRLPERAGRALAVAGDQLITGGAGWWRWSLTPPPPPRRFVAPSGLSSAAISPDGAWLAAARGDGRLSIWSTTTGDLVASPTLADTVIKRIDFSADGAYLAAGISGPPHTAVLATADWRPTAHQPASASGIRLAYLRDELVAAHYVMGLTRWRAGGGPERVDGTGYVDAERTAARDALWLLTAAGDIARYQGGAITALVRVPGADAVVPAADGHRFAVARAGAVELHDLADGSMVPLVGSGERVIDVAISPDDAWLAAASAAGTIDVWSLVDGRRVAHLRGHQQRVAWLGFAAGALWSAGWDRVVLRWDLVALSASPSALAADAAATWALP